MSDDECVPAVVLKAGKGLGAFSAIGRGSDGVLLIGYPRDMTGLPVNGEPSNNRDAEREALHLGETEGLLWHGRPDPRGRATKAVRRVKLVGWVLLACFAFFALMGWLNRDDLDGAGGILAVFLMISGGTALAFLWGIPALSRRLLATTRYGVTDRHALIVRGIWGHREALRYPIAEHTAVDVVDEPDGFQSVHFARAVGRVNPTASHGRTVSMGVGFDRLAPDEAARAADALEQIRGKGGRSTAMKKTKL